ncbi:lectin C-type domain protein [Ancylostoma ceylanicum]|uniref:Lectin C-type domain protein n=1 Tax=Ancylostoma ceylanicum TaxID=53326 RepID=A0A0D6LMY1_9BILA|nr:lectin C-type domain protein [Ancylostoma ceylanicum]
MICWKDYVSEHVAQTRCRKERADLASIHSKDENDFVTEVAYGDGMGLSGMKVWIGLHKNKHGGWEWSDGTPYDYNNWDDKQPDNYNCHETESPEDCTQIYSSGKWNDLRCDGLVRKGVCKRKWIPLEMEKLK